MSCVRLFSHHQAARPPPTCSIPMLRHYNLHASRLGLGGWFAFKPCTGLKPWHTSQLCLDTHHLRPYTHSNGPSNSQGALSHSTYTSPCCQAAGSLAPKATWPALQLQLLDSSANQLCNLPFAATGRQADSLFQATALYQNAQDCISLLDQAASLSFVTDADEGQAVCLADLGLLPSTTLPAGQHPCFCFTCSEGC